MNPVLLGYLRLLRPANLPTAAADILAGIALAGISMETTYLTVDGIRLFPDTLFLCLASVFLYAGGVVLNDVFDYKTDLKERPERPIPKGLVTRRSAAIYGSVLLLTGLSFAFLVNNLSGLIAVFLVLAILSYDAIAKKHAVFGPLNMGVCRGLNLLLGMSIAGQLHSLWYALIPVAYIYAVTLISRGEVHAGNKKQLIWAGILYVAVIFVVLMVIANQTESLAEALPFVILFAVLIFVPLIKAFRQNTADYIRKAVVAGVLSIVALDAALAAGFANWWYGLMVILLLPLSLVLTRIFSVT